MTQTAPLIPTFRVLPPVPRAWTVLAFPPAASNATIIKALSSDRFNVYLTHGSPSVPRAWAAYSWNLRVSAHLFQVIAHTEVAFRNAVNSALVGTFGNDWHYNPGFLRTVPRRQADNLVKARDESARKRRLATLPMGQFVAGQTLWFWQAMLASRFRERVWKTHFHRVFPGASQGLSILQEAYEQLEALRKLRNRIAHHESLLHSDVQVEYTRALSIIEWTCPAKAVWVHTHWPMPEEYNGPP